MQTITVEVEGEQFDITLLGHDAEVFAWPDGNCNTMMLNVVLATTIG